MVDNKTFNIDIEPDTNINLEHIKFDEWDFFWNVEKMLTSKELDLLGEKVKVKNLPEMMFGHNRFFIVNQNKNFIIEISPIQMLDLSVFTEQKSKLAEAGSRPVGQNLNFVYYEPKNVRVQYYDKWKNIKHQREDVQKVESVSDWTYSSPYMGNIEKLSEHNLNKNNQGRFKDNLDSSNNIRIEASSEELPVHRLGQDNPILHFMQVSLFDDELCDNGHSQGNFR